MGNVLGLDSQWPYVRVFPHLLETCRNIGSNLDQRETKRRGAEVLESLPIVRSADTVVGRAQASRHDVTEPPAPGRQSDATRPVIKL